MIFHIFSNKFLISDKFLKKALQYFIGNHYYILRFVSNKLSLKYFPKMWIFKQVWHFKVLLKKWFSTESQKIFYFGFFLSLFSSLYYLNCLILVIFSAGGLLLHIYISIFFQFLILCWKLKHIQILNIFRLGVLFAVDRNKYYCIFCNLLLLAKSENVPL